MLRLDECRGRPEAGAKAERLAQARAAGLPVLDGVVLLPGDTVDVEALRALGEKLIVRSSSRLEDAPGASAAGVFESVANVTLDGVAQAVERVRASAEGARAYLAAKQLSPQPLAVLIQPMSKAPKLAVAMTAAPGFVVEERRAGEPEWGDVEARAVEAGPLFETLRRLEALVGGPVDAELALDGDAITVLQLRPRVSGPLEAIDAAFAVPGRWKLDAEHNPRPLSPAQAGLVALVEELGVGPRQQVIAGYLYVEVGAPPRGLSPLPLGDLRRRFDEEVAPDCRAQMAAAVDLPSALSAYRHVFRRYVGELAPSVARAKQQLDQMLRMNLGEPLSRHAALLGGTGGAALRRDQALWELGQDRGKLPQYLAEFGAWSPAWDVAVPTDEEEPERLLPPPVEPLAQHQLAVAAAEQAAHDLLERLDRMARRAFKALLPTVRAAVEVGEDDDALFFEAQRMVRRALLSLGVDGVFDMPLERVRRGLYDLKSAPIKILEPPLGIEDGKPVRRLPPSREVLRGHATAGSARGRAVRPGQALPEDAVLVLPALLPSLAYLLPRCRALVTEHGGATSHGATLAREYGIPAVLGARGAAQIADGAELYVDGAGGRVYLL